MQTGFINEVNKLNDFLNGSGLFVAHYGHYDLGRDHLLVAYEHYILTGEYVLHDLTACYHVLDILGTEYVFDNYLKNWIYKYLSNNGFWDTDSLITPDQRVAIKSHLRWQLQQKKYRRSYKYRREQSSLKLGDKAFRAKVFKIYGERCANCGTTTRLSIDHIIPVVHGGLDEIENLQVLCISCNSSKGSKYEQN